MASPPTDADIVSISALHLAATVGPDHWHRVRPQPIHLSLHLHLSPLCLNTPGQSDNVTDSLHYGHLAKAVERRIGSRARPDEDGGGYPNPRALIDDVIDAARGFVSDRGDGQRAVEVSRVRVVLELPKQILLARGFEVELAAPASRSAGGSGPDSSVCSGTTTTGGAIVRVSALTLPVLIGVNPPERLARQHVVTHLTFFEAARTGPHEIESDYPSIVQQIVTDVENSSHLTLEKLVYEIVHTAYRALDAHSTSNTTRIDAITVRCQKPSALSFADASGVEMTRTREALGL